jgi:hypothetical protein
MLNGFKRKLTSNKLDVIKSMPPGYHKLPDREFDIHKSKVVKWLIQQPEILQYLWDEVARRTEHVVYNPTTGLWVGVDYESLCPHNDKWDDCPDCRH